jgi:signal transduction histidine kinase
VNGHRRGGGRRGWAAAGARHLRRPVVSLRLVPWAILVGALVFTVSASLMVARTDRQRDLARFENAVLSTQDLMNRRVDLYVATLRGAAGLYSALDTVRLEDFRTYVERLEVQRHFPGIQGIGWSQRLAAEPDGEGGLFERHSIDYLEPMDIRNRAAIGYDMYSEPTRRLAMARARDLAEPALSGRVRLVQEIFGPEQAGFLIYVPVYRGGQPPPGLEERRAALKGFVYSPFRAGDLFQGVFGSELRPRVRFRVYDGAELDEARRLYESPGDPDYQPRFRTTRSMMQAGAPWRVVFESTAAFDRTFSRRAPLAVLVLGLAASLWLFSLARGQSRAREAAEAANRTKSAFLATMSHELRTPLNAIAGYVDLLAAGVAGQLTPRHREFLGRIDHAQRHLLALIDNILNFAKLEAGRVEFRTGPVRVERVVAEAEAMMEAEFVAKGLEYVREEGPPLLLQADPEKVHQILLNLMGNAAKFTRPGGRVVVGWTAAGQTVRIEVTDTGVGIEAGKLSEIFEPFVQGDGDLTRTSHGTGLGLSISRQLARAMGGDVTVASETGRGSRFTLSLPRHPDDAA